MEQNREKKQRKINEGDNRTFEKIDQIDKSLAGLIRKKREKKLIANIRNVRRDVITNPVNIKKLK